MKRISLFITLPQYHAIRSNARRLGMGLAELIRRAIAEYLERHDDE